MFYDMVVCAGIVLYTIAITDPSKHLFFNFQVSGVNPAKQNKSIVIPTGIDVIVFM